MIRGKGRVFFGRYQLHGILVFGGSVELMVYKDFDPVWDVYLAGSQGDFIQCDPPLSKHEFLRCLRNECGAVFHGSNNPDIIILEPRTATGTGPNQALGAVYATADPSNATVVSHANYSGISLERCS